MPPLTVVFDLDGTLIDTLNVVFARQGLPEIAYAEARNMIGGGAKRMIEQGLQREGRRCTPAELDRLFNDFIAHYRAHIADRSRPFPGLDAALDTLAARGCRFAVCTIKLEGLSRALLDALGMTARFGDICGQDTFGIQ
jgi:phosphoglycolate phosphatase